ncbi:hypothetical protein [Haematobacter sp. UBA3484]|uniref:hypothetical protein n=1 Tax=Haematobacter sp. UBA3484 TaxID=1946582 RepID=UPI0025BEC5C1|nr:hypothetical protein [Haematobacter sp. UBA3484]
MRAFALAAAAVVGLSGAAEAAVYRFDFAWTQIRGEPDIYDETVNGGYFRRSSGVLVIDEARYPGGSIANTTFRFVSHYWPQLAEISISGSYTHTASTSDVDIPSFLGTVGVAFSGSWPAEYPMAMENEIVISFDSAGQVLSFSGSETVGGTEDYVFGGPGWNPYWDEFFDYGYDDPSERIPSTVVRTTLIPAPVPLPAAAPLLLAGTAALWAISRRRQRVTDR